MNVLHDDIVHGAMFMETSAFAAGEFSTTFNNAGVQTVNEIALKVLKTFPEALILDDYALTFNRCTCTAMQDGRHYGPLIPIWWDFVLNILKSCTP